MLDLLNPVTQGVELTDEQMSGALEQLQSSIAACGNAIAASSATGPMAILKQEPGWLPWEMQVARESGNNVSERVTFERQGDPIALRAEIEAQVRREIEQEYESRPSELPTCSANRVRATNTQ